MIDEKKLIEDIINTPSKIMNEIPYEKTMFDNIHKRQNEILDVINRQPRVGEWIPCSERLPEAEGEYLCSLYYAIPPYNLFHPENDIYIHTISIQKFDGTSFKSSVIAWMPLPPAFKGE